MTKNIDKAQFLEQGDTVLIEVTFAISAGFDFEESIPTAQDITILSVEIEGVISSFEAAEEIMNCRSLESAVAKEKFGTY